MPEQLKSWGPRGTSSVGRRAAITSISGFAKIYADAAMVLTVSEKRAEDKLSAGVPEGVEREAF